LKESGKKECSFSAGQKTNADVSESLARRMQWGRALAGMEAVGALPDAPSDSVNV
jgi:hypothetical protein